MEYPTIYEPSLKSMWVWSLIENGLLAPDELNEIFSTANDKPHAIQRVKKAALVRFCDPRYLACGQHVNTFRV